MIRGAEAAPLGRVTIRAKLINRRSRTVIAQRHFDAQVRASENRLSAIAAAVDSAAHQGGRALGAWAANQLEAAEEAAKR
ncbi:MAG: hypothetical protein Q9M45_04155 [Robiginitomaculum sp.]|nr:hypothetical protein [Robiginitomaculum sp.]